ncbi:MAG: 16S rRNA (cytidine(1402)-2'-O)-methyltransferase [Bacteroidota bacterium]
MRYPTEPGTLYIVSTPIGNLSDITLRALQVLSSVDLIAAEDTRTTRILLEHYGIKTPMISYYARNEKLRAPELVNHLRQGKTIALVSDAGTPAISDPGAILVRAAIESNQPIVPIPGPTAFVAALTLSGLRTDRFVFEGFLPTKKGRKRKLSCLAQEMRTIVLYESSHRLLKTLRELVEAMGERRASVSRELTKKYEETVRGSLPEILSYYEKRSVKGEFIIVIEGIEHAKRREAFS